MGPNCRAQERAAAKAQSAEAERKAAAEAQKIIAIWNAPHAGGRSPNAPFARLENVDGRAAVKNDRSASGLTRDPLKKTEEYLDALTHLESLLASK
jgi:hypothetical protein